MFDNWSDGDVLTLVGDAHRSQAMEMARKLAGIAELLERRIAEELEIDADVASMITGFRRTTAEVSAAMGMTAARARALVGHAEALSTRLPAVGSLLATGEVDWDTVELVLSRTDLTAEHLIAQVDASIAEQIRCWQRWSRAQVIIAVDQAVALVDAEAVKQRRVAAYDDRSVTVVTDPDGMAVIRIKVSATEGASADAQFSAMAKAVCPDDPRTLKQRRADAFVAMKYGHMLTCRCPNPDCALRGTPATTPPETTPPGTTPPECAEAPQSEQPSTPAPPTDISAPAPPSTPAPPPDAPAPPPFTPGPRVVLQIIAGADTVTGHSDAPGYLCGFGVIDAELVRELGRDATRLLVERPEIGADDRAALTYRPSAALARYIRARDLTCRFPGCSVPAHRCDIDHTEPFNHDNPTSGGLTVPSNLACYCREHHRHKTFDKGWRDRQLDDGTIIWTSPTNQTYVTTPAGADLFPGLTRPRRPEDTKRVTAARRDLNAHRDTSTTNRYRNNAAREEIRLRQWRNQFRRFREFFHGQPTTTKPSTSPYARFVNDSIEPEQLPPHWQPPPQTPTNRDDPPPF